jgi:hypothetical protein
MLIVSAYLGPTLTYPADHHDTMRGWLAQLRLDAKRVEFPFCDLTSPVDELVKIVVDSDEASR